MNRLILPQYIIYLEATEKATNLSNPNPSTPSSIEGRKKRGESFLVILLILLHRLSARVILTTLRKGFNLEKNHPTLVAQVVYDCVLHTSHLDLQSRATVKNDCMFLPFKIDSRRCIFIAKDLL